MKLAEFNIILKSMINHTFCSRKDMLTHDELVHIFNNMDYDLIEDRYLADDPRLYPLIKWDRVGKMQAIRMAARNLDILQFVDLKKHQYRIREIFFLIKRDFNILFKYFNFDFENLSHDDAYFLLCLGRDEFYYMINVQKYDFNFIEIINILRAYKYRRDVILNLNYTELKNYQITEILIVTGEENLDLFDLDCLSTLNWLELLLYQPKFIKKCNFEKFISGDPFNLVQLVVMFEKPDLTYLIDEIDIKNITPFGWEKLLISRPDKFGPVCDVSKLNETNWAVILNYSPELIVYKI